MPEREEQIYKDAIILMKSNDINLILSAVEYFNSISEYKDAATKKQECLDKIKKIEIRMEKDRKYMKANIVIICISMIAILAILIVLISAMIYQHNNVVRKFTEVDPVTTSVAKESESITGN